LAPQLSIVSEHATRFELQSDSQEIFLMAGSLQLGKSAQALLEASGAGES
jgi:hypothetical protein